MCWGADSCSDIAEFYILLQGTAAAELLAASVILTFVAKGSAALFTAGWRHTPLASAFIAILIK